MEHQPVEVNSLPHCTHIFSKSGRHCRQSVAKLGVLLCTIHAKQLALSAPPIDPLAELAAELGDLSEIHEVSEFLAKILTLACQNRISISRATALTFIANSLLNSLRLLKSEERMDAKQPQELVIDWEGVPRPDRETARIRADQPISDSTHLPVSN